MRFWRGRGIGPATGRSLGIQAMPLLLFTGFGWLASGPTARTAVPGGGGLGASMPRPDRLRRFRPAGPPPRQSPLGRAQGCRPFSKRLVAAPACAGGPFARKPGAPQLRRVLSRLGCAVADGHLPTRTCGRRAAAPPPCGDGCSGTRVILLWRVLPLEVCCPWLNRPAPSTHCSDPRHPSAYATAR